MCDPYYAKIPLYIKPADKQAIVNSYFPITNNMDNGYLLSIGQMTDRSLV
jgi:hypothetical protein